jgi:hypothetical protein
MVPTRRERLLAWDTPDIRATSYARSLVIESPTMQEVRVESLDKLEARGGCMRLSANSGALLIDFPQKVWDNLLTNAPTFTEPTHEERAELAHIEEQLRGFADEESFGSVLRDVPCGDSGVAYDLVLRPAGLFAMTTGFFFVPVVDAGLVAKIGGDGAVEQAYVVGAVAGEEGLLSGDENLRVLSVRGRSCSTSRFEMPPELWQVLSGRLGWRDVHTITTGR